MALTIDAIQVAEKYLGRFGRPECYILKSKDEPGGPTPDGIRLASKFHSKKYGIKEILTVNYSYPVGVHFTPNGNFADNNVKTGKLVMRKTGYEGAKPYWKAMIADFDRKDSKDFKSKTNEEYYEYLIEKYIDVEGLPTPDYLQETPGGFHFVWIIKQTESEMISKFLSDSDVSNAMYFIQATAYGGVSISSKKLKSKVRTITGIDVGRQRFLTSASIRLPGSKHWKTGTGHEVMLYRIYREKTILYRKRIYHAKDIDEKRENNELTFEMLKGWAVKYSEIKKSEQVLEKIIINNIGFDRMVFDQIDKIRMPDILEKLAGTYMSYGGKHYSLRYRGVNNTILIENEDGTVHETSGYRYWEEANMMREFNGNKSISERPQGSPTRFLYYFFGRNWKFVSDFTEKHFGLKLIKSDDEDIGVLRHSTVGENDIVCYPNKIVMKKLVSLQSGAVVPKVTDIFQQPFTVIGKGKTSLSASQGETESEEQVFIIKKYGSDDKILLRCYPTKRLWNQDNIGKGLFFYGDDNDLGLFYDAIFNDKTIPEYEIVGRNGYFDGYYVFGGQVFPMEEHNPVFNICKGKGFQFDIQKGEDIHISDYIKKGINVWDEKIFVPTLLQAIALAGVDIRNRLENFNQFPGLLLTGYTGSGKTVLHETISLAMGYAKKTRSLSISRTSPQPLKQAGIDGSILHLEEFTDPIKLSSEDILRDILNRSTSARGTPGKNIIWKYRSSPFVDGESMPQSESVANRFVIIPVDKRYWRGDTDAINSIQKFSIFNELYETRYELGKDVKKLSETVTKWINFLTKGGVNPRTANVWAPMFTVNELFNIGYSEQKLLKHALELMKDVGISHGDEKRITPFMRLRIFLAEAVMERKISISETAYSHHSQITCILQKEYATKNISIISKIINEINAETLAWYNADLKRRKVSDFKPLTFFSPMLILNINDINVSPTDTALNDIREKYIKHLSRSIYSYYGQVM